MGITEEGGGPWRISHANEDFKLSPTYPSLLVVPSEMTDQGTSTAPFGLTIQRVSGTQTPLMFRFSFHRRCRALRMRQVPGQVPYARSLLAIRERRDLSVITATSRPTGYVQHAVPSRSHQFQPTYVPSFFNTDSSRVRSIIGRRKVHQRTRGNQSVGASTNHRRQVQLNHRSCLRALVSLIM
jgi:hypothetical protein